MYKILCYALMAFCLSFGYAHAANCTTDFVNGTPPVVTHTEKTQALCFDAFATLHSGISREPVYSAEHLVGKDLAGGHPDRVNAFHPESQVAPADRAELADYAKTGYDRGHMAPSADMLTEAAQNQSFSLANMVPQVPENNRRLWRMIESGVRDMAVAEGELYVISGPVFEGANVQLINNRVMVPTSLFKAVYDPKKKAAAAYYVKNSKEDHYEFISIAELKKRTGIDVFPGYNGPQLDLPKPNVH